MTAARILMMGMGCGVLLATAAHAQLTVAPGYALQTVFMPALVQGGVVKRGNALIVGQGGFGAGNQWIVRLEAGRTTRIATGFGDLGGFDLADDGTLYVVDNCYTQDLGCITATTGDTVYAISDALTRTTPLDAGDAELLPAGSIGSPFDVLATPLGLLVSDAAGAGVGRVVRVEASGVVDVVTGLDYVAGLAFDDPSLYVANVAADSSGEIQEYVHGSALGALVDELPGAAGLALDGDGDLLLGAGSALLEVDAAGDTAELASGFSLAGDVAYDPDSDAALVVAFGASGVFIVCPDEDGDAVCDATCSDGLPLEGARLSFGEGKEPGAGSLRFKARLRIDGGPTADPSEDGMGIQLLDDTGARVLDVVLPGGDAWRVKKKDRGWRYRDKSGALGVTDLRVTLDRRDDEVVRVAVRSRKRSALAPLTVVLPLRAVVVLDPVGECGVSAFTACALRDFDVSCQ
jgi:hypothetical protein